MKYAFLTAAALSMLAAASASAQNRSVEMSGIAVDYRGTVEGDGEFSGASVDVSGSFGGDLEVSGGAVDVDADVGGQLEASGGAVDLNGSFAGFAEISGGAVDINAQFGSDVEISAGALDISEGSRFAGEFDLSVGAADLNGTYEGRMDVEFGEMEFGGHAFQAVSFEGDHRSGIFRRRDRSEIHISGRLDQGGEVCAHEVEFREGARIGGTLLVRADSEPTFESGVDRSNVRFELRDGDCD
ncbi:hypothetical protein [Hyphobacterium marinum]|uniref:Uncharacterized protein n=1 Tax=Hyphobacterium marinum TaxID=3116574 RepID=A0ABU7LYD9_9PROT|nr:hypothetical protein [Hyphobacterium sp. Y6023]MEE2566577.1 hypothetical protein [Hyphobacterium sp. Y6023]